MEQKKFNYDIGFQIEVLGLMLRDEVFLYKCRSYLKNEYFENDVLGYFFTKIIQYYEKYQKIPEQSVLLNEIRRFDPSKREPYIIIYQKMIQAIFRPQIAEDYIRDQLKDFICRNQFVRLYEKIGELYNSSPDKAYQYTMEKAEEIVSFSFGTGDTLTLNMADQFHKSSTSGVVAPTGIPQIDVALGGGVQPGELGTWMADSGVGKSITLINQGCLSLLSGRKVYHVNLEGKRTIPIFRYLSRLSFLPYNEVKTGIFSSPEAKSRYEEAKKKYDSNLLIHHVSSFDFTVEDLYAKCKEVRKSFPFEVLIVDYGDLLTTREKMELRHQQTTVFRGLAKLAAVFEVPTLTASQATRPEKEFNSEKFWITQRNMSESYEKVRVSSVILTLNRTTREELENKLRVGLIKNRDGVKNVRVGCYNDYSKMAPYGMEFGFFDPGTELMSDGVIQT